ncbi:MAG: S9 family peptidase [Deltaproteobacteria bacterium]|nr:S9 family peptidase [Deltaproteobacteria bacterium]
MNFIFLTMLSAGLVSASPRVLTVEDLIKVKKVSQITYSKPHKNVYFTVSSQNATKNTKGVAVYRANLKENKSVKITGDNEKAWSPSVSPDGKTLAYISYIPGKSTKGPQIVLRNIKTGKITTLTDTNASASGPLVWSPDGKKIFFNSLIHRHCYTMECVDRKVAEEKKKKTGARLFDRLMYRHWNHWRYNNINQLLSADTKTGKVSFPLGIADNPTAKDVPPVSLGGSQDYAFSPDAKEFAFVMNTESLVAKSTNNDVFTYRARNKNAHLKSKSKGNDFSPSYSPDGRYLAFLSMARAGYESDKAVIVLLDRKNGKYSRLTDSIDLSVAAYAFAPDEKRIYFTTQEKGHINMYSVNFKGKIRPEFKNTFITDFKILSRGKIFIINQTISTPPEIFFHRGEKIKVEGKRIRDNSKLSPISKINDKTLNNIPMGKVEELWVKGSNGDQVHSLILYPPHFKKGNKYPVVFLIHGGPQGAFGYDFHPRWNSQLFAAPGYVVVMVNFHGSTGYGIKFQDAIRGDWGGGPYKDIMAVLDVVEKKDWAVKGNICAAGASYGGYMINWIGTQNTRFKCLISHSGVFNIESMYGSTEELWFPEWENKGTPWENRKTYQKWSPHQYVKNWKTPTLVVHGAKDFRVTVDQGYQLFTSLQRLGVKSKFLYFPTEDHFVFKPANRLIWWNNVHTWLKTYLTK